MSLYVSAVAATSVAKQAMMPAAIVDNLMLLVVAGLSRARWLVDGRRVSVPQRTLLLKGGDRDSGPARKFAVPDPPPPEEAPASAAAPGRGRPSHGM